MCRWLNKLINMITSWKEKFIQRIIFPHLVIRMLIKFVSVYSWESTCSLIHLKIAPALGSIAIWRPNSDCTRRRGNMKLSFLSSKISSMRSFLWSISVQSEQNFSGKVNSQNTQHIKIVLFTVNRTKKPSLPWKIKFKKMKTFLKKYSENIKVQIQKRMSNRF